MSGGSFDYRYQHFEQMADELAEKIARNNKRDRTGWRYGFSPETLRRLRECEQLIRAAGYLAKEVEWLYSANSGEETFMRRSYSILEELQ